MRETEFLIRKKSAGRGTRRPSRSVPVGSPPFCLNPGIEMINVRAVVI